MTKINLQLTDDGSLEMLHDDSFDTSYFGIPKIKRASHVEFDNEKSKWKVTSAKTKKILKENFNTRQEAINWEKEYYSPGTKGFEEIN